MGVFPLLLTDCTDILSNHPQFLNSGNVLDLWIVFLRGSQSIHCDLSYPQIQNTTHLSYTGRMKEVTFSPPFPRMQPVTDISRDVGL
jgi:hypothetical protein